MNVGRPRRTEPLVCKCTRPGCDATFEVRWPAEPKRRKYCSPRCAGLMNSNLQRAADIARPRSAATRHSRVLERLAGLSNRECYELGYKHGLSAQGRRRTERELSAGEASQAAGEALQRAIARISHSSTEVSQ